MEMAFIAFGAGVVSFLSPCILPLVPAYLGYIIGSGLKESSTYAKLLRILGFIIGFTIIFTIMGASATYLGQVFGRYRHIFVKVSGIVIIIFGLHLTGLLQLNFLYREARFKGPNKASNWFQSLLIGMTFAAGWSPCVGPVLASILLYAGTADTISQGIMLLLLYSLGMGIPFLVVGLGAEKAITRLDNLKRYLPLISKISGVILIIFGMLVYLDLVQRITGYFY